MPLPTSRKMVFTISCTIFQENVYLLLFKEGIQLFSDVFSTLNSSSLNLVDKFTYLGSSVSSTEKGINMRLAKAYIAIDWLSVIRKSDLTDKIKYSFFPSSGCVDTVIRIHYMDANSTYEEKA